MLPRQLEQNTIPPVWMGNGTQFRSRIDISVAGKSTAARASEHNSMKVLQDVVDQTSEPAFEIVVLGSGGGPLETDCAGYLVKAIDQRWEDGILGLEGGSGLGALSALFSSQSPDTMFPGITFPTDYSTPLLQASYVFSFVSGYLITHAHLDHVQSLIMLTGSAPPRPNLAAANYAPVSQPVPPLCPIVYGTTGTLEKLSTAYTGQIWPELVAWVPGHNEDRKTEAPKKRRKVNQADKRKKSKSPESDTRLIYNEHPNASLVLSPLQTNSPPQSLIGAPSLGVRLYPLVHGSTSKETYESSGAFIRHMPLPYLSPKPVTGVRSRRKPKEGKEFLFLGDMESAYRKSGENGAHPELRAKAGRFNSVIWEEAARSWIEGRLCGIFIECSYDSSRLGQHMYGHLSPPAVYHELKVLAGHVSQTKTRPLDGLKIFITHIKESLVPHPEGKTQHEIIMAQLQELEKDGKLGVAFIRPVKGDRIGCIRTSEVVEWEVSWEGL
ncbi:hypothetical protein AYX13_03034 [Cryptococcus neoformans]|nr:hypothetical protein AYX13_03034 [Cryptococcus neoformans var. grubii]